VTTSTTQHTASTTAATRLAALEAAASAGETVDAAAYAEAVASAAAETRLVQLADAGRRRHVEDQSVREARRAQDDAKVAVAQRMAVVPADMLRVFEDAVAALRRLANGSETYGAAFTDAVGDFSRGRVAAAVVPEPEPGLNDQVDPANHAQYALGRYDRAEIVVTDGVTHLLPADPAVWLLAALHEATSLPEGRSMTLPGGRSVHNLIGRRERPYLP
jgi:hypothetical protein